MITHASGEAALLRRAARRGTQPLGQAGEVALGRENQPVARFVGEDVLAEPGRQRGETFDDRRVACLRRLR